ncbi:MAG: DNA repair protein RecO [Clostridia bacterium]|nr:DNA repair protein RecO [Clostridia bacterium]
MRLVTSGIVLKTVKLSDSDILITLFSDKHGKITAVAKGARNARSKLNAASQLFVYGEYSLSMGAKWNYVNSVEVYDAYYTIREDLESLTYASYFVELTSFVLPEDTANLKLFSILKNVLECLKDQRAGGRFLKVVYELKCLDLLGYRPETTACIQCGNEEQLYFMSIEEGGVLCESCALNLKKGLKIGKKLSRLMTLILNEDTIKLCQLEINDFYVEKMDILLNNYLKHHVGVKRFKSIEFLDTLNILKE